MITDMTPKFSVIIPYYNMGRYIDECLDSVLSQRLQEIQIILVNDGSTEKESLDKLKELKKRYKDEVIFIDQKNKGLPGARNAGIRKSKGEFICCLDADDKIEPDYLLRTSEVFWRDKKKEYGIVTSWVKFFGDKKDTWKIMDYNKFALFSNNRLQSASTFRKEAWERVGGFDEKMTEGYEDWDFWLRIITNGLKWHTIKRTYINYRISSTSMVNASNKKREKLFGYIVKKNIDAYRRNIKGIMTLVNNEYNELLNDHFNKMGSKQKELDKHIALADNRYKELSRAYDELQKLNVELVEKQEEIEELRYFVNRVKQTKLYKAYRFIRTKL